ncbi:unnamed protein product, partial [Ascophyllum nodosum]
MTAGLYEGATFYFLVTIPPSYPSHAPSAVYLRVCHLTSTSTRALYLFP